MKPSKSWFVIINPTSGNGLSRKKWPQIKALLVSNNFNFEFVFSEYKNHSTELTQEAIGKGFKNIICIGGDGTLHNIINGIMCQNSIESSKISVGVIPIGTGNDWIKTYNLPNDIEKAVEVLKNGKTEIQDLGKIDFLSSKKTSIYFNNLAGLGFDGYVVSKVEKYKKFGALAYLLGTLESLFSFKNFNSKVSVNSKVITDKALMILVGLCRYSGGGMQLTDTPNPNDGLLDICMVTNFSKFDIIKNLSNLYNGKIARVKKVITLKTQTIQINIKDENAPFIQADGELLGKGDVLISIVPKAFSFYCK